MYMRVRQFALLVLMLLLVVETGHSTMHVVQKEVSTSRALAGHILVRGTDEPASGVTVELRSSDWKTVLATTKTDEKGYFSLEQPTTGKLFYIRVSGSGMDIYDLRVRINEHAADGLTIHLGVAS
jgi:5-hydroxyisourate hydrolase-like protein (transthyretin family)